MAQPAPSTDELLQSLGYTSASPASTGQPANLPIAPNAPVGAGLLTAPQAQPAATAGTAPSTDDLLAQLGYKPAGQQQTQTQTAPPQGFVQPRDVARQPDTNALSLSDIGPLLHTAAAGVSPLADKYSAMMNAGPSAWLGLTNIPGSTYGERYRNRLAALAKERRDLAAQHPLASTIATTTGMIGGDIPRVAIWGPYAPAEIGAEAGLAAAPDTGWGPDIGYTAAGVPLGWGTAKLAGSVIKPLSELGTQLARYVQDPVERYLTQRSAGPVAEAAPSIMRPLVKAGIRSIVPALGYLHGGAEEGVIGGLASRYITEPLSDSVDEWLAKRAAAKAGAAAEDIVPPTEEEWAAHEAKMLRMPPSMRTPWLRPSGPSLLTRVAPVTAAHATTSGLADVLSRHLSEYAGYGD